MIWDLVGVYIYQVLQMTTDEVTTGLMIVQGQLVMVKVSD